MDFSMKVVLITGASRGLGRALSLRFAEVGFAVAINYFKSKTAAEEAVREITDHGGKAELFCCDVKSSVEVGNMIDRIIAGWGQIDILINNAAINTNSLLVRAKKEDWDDIIATNLTGPFYTTRAVSKYMMKKKQGHIINIASYVGLKGRSGQTAYTASKAGLIGLTKTAAMELGRFNIQVNAVLPGFMRTDMTEAMSESDMNMVINASTLKREQNISEVAEFIYSLSGMTQISGQVFNSDSRIE